MQDGGGQLTSDTCTSVACMHHRLYLSVASSCRRHSHCQLLLAAELPVSQLLLLLLHYCSYCPSFHWSCAASWGQRWRRERRMRDLLHPHATSRVCLCPCLSASCSSCGDGVGWRWAGKRQQSRRRRLHRSSRRRWQLQATLPTAREGRTADCCCCSRMDTADTTMVPSCTCLLCHGVIARLVAAMQRDDRSKRGPQDGSTKNGGFAHGEDG